MTQVTPVESAGVPKYYPLSWAEFRRRRFEGDFGTYGADVQISDWLIEGGKYGGGRGGDSMGGGESRRDGGESRRDGGESRDGVVRNKHSSML